MSVSIFFLCTLLYLGCFIFNDCAAFVQAPRLIVSASKNKTTKSNGRAPIFLAGKKDGYQFGDITRSVVGKFQNDVNSLSGKSKYEFGTLQSCYPPFD